MPTTYNQTVPLDSSQYYVGDIAEVWVHPTALTYTSPTPVQSSLLKTAGGTIAPGGTSITLTTATTTKLYDKQRIKLANGQTVVIDASAQTASAVDGTRSIPSGATVLSVYPVIATVTWAATETYEVLVPFFSCDMADFAGSATLVDFRNFGTNPYKVKKKSSFDTTFTTDGYVTRLDPALPFLRTIANTMGSFCKIRFIPPDNQALEFTAEVSSDKRSTKVGDAFRAPFDFAPGAPTMIDLTPS